MKKDHQTDRGIATIELLIALAVGVVMLTGATLVSFGGQTAGLDTGLTRAGLSRSFDNFGKNVAAVAASWDNSSVNSESDSFYTHTASASDISPCVKLVEGGVGWTSGNNQGLSTQLETLVASTTIAKKLGGDCDPFPSGDWNAPNTRNIHDPIFSGSLATDVDVVRQPYFSSPSDSGRFALVTALFNSGMGAGTFWMVDVTDLDTSIDPRPYSKYETPDDLYAVDAIDDFAFVAGATTTDQRPFQIFDISDETNIALVAEVPLPNTSHGSFDKARSIYYYDSKVYIGTDYMIGSGYHELHVFEFDNLNPSTPTWLGSFNIDREVNDIVVDGNYAYLATGSGGDNTVMKVYDISNPASISLVGEYAALTSEPATAIYKLGDYVYIGRERVNPVLYNELFTVIDVSDPTNPTRVSGADLRIKNDSRVSGIHVRGSNAFLVTSDTVDNNSSGNNGDGPFIIYDVSDPTNIVLDPPCTSVNWSEKATGMDMVDNVIFVSNESGDALRVILPTLSCS